MASNDVTIVIKADGTAAIKGFQQLDTQVQKSEKHAGGLGKALGDVTKIAGGIVLAKAFDAGTSAIKGAFTAAVDFQKMQAATAAVIESTGGKAGITAKEVVSLSNKLERLTAVDDQVIQGAQNLLLTFTNIGKDVFPEATKTVLNMSTALGQDAKSSAIQLGKALNDPIKGITALTRVGVSFTAEQKSQIKAMVEAGDVMGAQKIILAELETEFGGAAEAAGKTLGGQLSLLKDTVSDTFRDMAIKALPVVTDLAGLLAGALTEGIDLATAGLGKIMGPLQSIAGVTWDALKDGADALAKLGAVAWDKIEGPLKVLAGITWDALKDGAAALRDFASVKIDQLAPQFERLRDAIRSVDMKDINAGLQTLREKLEPAINFLKPLAERVLVALKDAFRDVSNALKPLDDALKDLAEALKPLSPILEPLAKLFGSALVLAIGAWLLSVEGAIRAMTFVWTVQIKAFILVIKGIAEAIEFVTKVVQEWGPKIGYALGNIGRTIAENVRSMVAFFDPLMNIGAAIIDGIVAGIQAGAQRLMDAAKAMVDWIESAIPDWIPHSPSKIGVAIGEGFVDGIVSGWQSKSSVLATASKGLMSAVGAGLEDGWKPVAAKLDGFNAKIAATFTGWQPAAAMANTGATGWGGPEWAALGDAGGWAPKNSALGSGVTGAYGQNLVWDEQNKAWTYPWATGGAFGARDSSGGIIYQPFGGQSQPQTIILQVDGEVLASVLATQAARAY